VLAMRMHPERRFEVDQDVSGQAGSSLGVKP